LGRTTDGGVAFVEEPEPDSLGSGPEGRARDEAGSTEAVDHAAGAHVEVTKLVEAMAKDLCESIRQRNFCGAVPAQHKEAFRSDLVAATVDMMDEIKHKVEAMLAAEDGAWEDMRANAEAVVVVGGGSGKGTNRLHSGVPSAKGTGRT